MSNNRVAVYTRMAEDQLYLNSTCLIAYCDLNASGLRSLLGVEARVEFWDLEVPGLRRSASLLPVACERWDRAPALEREFEALQVLNLKYEQYSLILVNTHVPGSRVHHVMQKLFDLFAQFKVSRIHLLSCLHLPGGEKLSAKLRAGNSDDVEDDNDDDNADSSVRIAETAFNNGVKLAPNLSSLDPAVTRVRDPFLCCFVQFALVEETPFSLLSVASHRSLGRPDAAAVTAFQEILSDRLGLQFRLDRSLDLRFHRPPVAPGGDSGMYI